MYLKGAQIYPQHITQGAELIDRAMDTSERLYEELKTIATMLEAEYRAERDVDPCVPAWQRDARRHVTRARRLLLKMRRLLWDDYKYTLDFPDPQWHAPDNDSLRQIIEQMTIAMNRDHRVGVNA